MKRTLLNYLHAFFSLLLHGFFPYIDELRDQGLTMLIRHMAISLADQITPFDPYDAVPQLDYSESSSWASLPFYRR